MVTVAFIPMCNSQSGATQGRQKGDKMINKHHLSHNGRT